MFDALEMSLVVLEQLVAIEPRIRRHNGELGKQLAKASQSIALNVAEGGGREDGDKRRHYEIAKGSAREVTAALRVAVLKGYITRDEFAAIDAPLDRVRAMLYRMATPRKPA